MSKKSKVFVFDRIELALLVFFFIAVGVTSFVLGIRIGKKNALTEVGITTEDQQRVEQLPIKSETEEYVDDLVEETPEAETTTATGNEKKDESIDEEAFQKLQEEFDKLDKKNFEGEKPKEDGESSDQEQTDLSPEEAQTPTPTPTEVPASSETTIPNSSNIQKADESIIGKYTIQIGSYKELSEAQGFAEGFLARGYKPLINEVEVSDKGKWYRVSIGVFQSGEAANGYIESEKELFNGSQYVVTKIE
jgi:septal ring-binding cell division protein DamX